MYCHPTKALMTFGAGRLVRPVLVLILSSASSGMAMTGNAPDVVEPDGEMVVLTTEPQPAAEPADRTELADTVRNLIRRARKEGSPRPLGRARALLERSDEADWTAELYVLRATIRQSLHRFDEAVADLETALEREPDHAQALFTRYSIARTRGRPAELEQACTGLARINAGLIAAACEAEAMALKGDLDGGWQRLQAALDNEGGGNRTARQWALVSRAALAELRGDDQAGRLWRHVLARDPQDSYVRARRADWLLRHDQPDAVVALTQGHTRDDQLAVLRLIALRHVQADEATALRADLEQRFREAQWRGDLLHKRAWARFLLDVADEPERALELARANWQQQRELPDRRLLNRSARAAGKNAPVEAPRMATEKAL